MIKHYRTLLLVFALFCNTVVIQAQNVSLKLNNVTVKEAIEAVKKQTGKSFFFNVNDVDLNHRVNIDLKDAPLGKALSQILQGQDIDYEVKDNHIVLSKRNSTKNNQTFTVVGQVTDEKGVPLIGVNITAKGHGNTVTDIDGNYSIKAAPGIALVFSYIGYLQESVKVNKQKTVNVQMTEDTKALNEVVVIGYGTQKKQSTGAVGPYLRKKSKTVPFPTSAVPCKELCPTSISPMDRESLMKERTSISAVSARSTKMPNHWFLSTVSKATSTISIPGTSSPSRC